MIAGLATHGHPDAATVTTRSEEEAAEGYEARGVDEPLPAKPSHARPRPEPDPSLQLNDDEYARIEELAEQQLPISTFARSFLLGALQPTTDDLRQAVHQLDTARAADQDSLPAARRRPSVGEEGRNTKGRDPAMNDGPLLGEAAEDPDEVLTFIRASLASQEITSDKLPEIRRVVEEYFEVQQGSD